MKRTIVFYLLLFLNVSGGLAQTNISTGNATTCSDTLYDNGGPSGSYSNSTNYTFTYYPGTSGAKIQADFVSFNMESGYDYLYVYDGNSTSANLIGSYTGTNLPDQIISTAADGSLTFKQTSDSSVTRDGFEIAISCFLPSSCPAPSNVSTSNITANAATIAWDTAGSETDSWTIEYGTAGFSLGNGTQVNNLTSNSYTVTDLTPATDYEVYVKAACTAGDETSWVGPISITTPCAALATIDQGFDANSAVPNCWDAYDPSSGTSAISSTYSYSSGNAWYLYNSYYYDVGIITPELSTLGQDYWLRFQAYSTSSSTKTLTIGTVDANNTFTQVETVTLSASNTWEAITVNFSGYTGSDSRIMIKHGQSVTYQSFYIDDVVWEPVPSCLPPQNVQASNVTGTAATLSWDTGGSGETQWTVEYGPSGFTLGSGSTVTVSQIPYTLQNLDPMTDYQVYVRANCAVDDVSSWSSVVAFTTGCGPVSAFQENFDTSAIPTCMDYIIVSQSYDVGTRSTNYYSAPYAIAIQAQGAILILPETTNSHANTHQLTLYARMFTGTGQFEMGYITDTADATTFTGLFTEQVTSTYQQYTFDLGSTPPEGAFLALKHASSGVVLFDDMVWESKGIVYQSGAWNNGTGPTATDNALINDDYTISQDLECNDLTIASGKTVTVAPGVSVTLNNDCNNDGTLVLQSNSTAYSSVLVTGTVSGTGTVTYNRYVNEIGTTNTSNGGNDLVAPPVSGQTFGSFAAANTNLAASGTLRAFAPFNTTSGAYENYDTGIHNTTTLDVGTGYRAATTDGAPLSFSGTINTGGVDVTLSNGTTFWNLIGNPYPSYISLEAFLNENSGNIDTNYVGIYGYDADTSDGSVWTVWDANYLSSNTNAIIAPGQGFFVAAPPSGSTVTFTPTMRRSGSDDDFISGRVADANFAQATITLSTATQTYSTNLYFRDTNTRGLDPGYDTGAYDGTANGIYTQLVQDNTGVNLYNQSLPFSDLGNIVVPLAVNANQGEQLTFALDAAADLPTGTTIYLEDNVSNTWILLNNQDYILTPSQDLNGAGRFYLHISNTTLSNANQSLNEFQVYVKPTSRMLVITGSITAKTNLKLYDLQGRLVLQRPLATQVTQQDVSLAKIGSGVYLVQLQNGTQTYTQKVIIQ